MSSGAAEGGQGGPATRTRHKTKKGGSEYTMKAIAEEAGVDKPDDEDYSESAVDQKQSTELSSPDLGAPETEEVTLDVEARRFIQEQEVSDLESGYSSIDSRTSHWSSRSHKRRSKNRGRRSRDQKRLDVVESKLDKLTDVLVTLANQAKKEEAPVVQPYQASSCVGRHVQASNRTVAASATPSNLIAFPSLAISDRKEAPRKSKVFDPVEDDRDELCRDIGFQNDTVDVVSRHLGVQVQYTDREVQVLKENLAGLKLYQSKTLSRNQQLIVLLGLIGSSNAYQAFIDVVSHMESDPVSSDEDWRRIFQVFKQIARDWKRSILASQHPFTSTIQDIEAEHVVQEDIVSRLNRNGVQMGLRGCNSMGVDKAGSAPLQKPKLQKEKQWRRGGNQYNSNNSGSNGHAGSSSNSSGGNQGNRNFGKSKGNGKAS